MSARLEHVAWRYHAPRPGRAHSAQELFLSCPFFECLLEGGRGGGKTSALLVDFLTDVGRGWGPEWSGILFRRTYKELGDVLAKSRALYPLVGPKCRFYESGSLYFWEWEGGERLYLRHMRTAADYWDYHGHAYPWQGWEELTTWPDLAAYQAMISTCRSTHPGVARAVRVRATTNPWGAGHGAVKAYYVDPAPAGVPIPDKQSGTCRVRLYQSLEENRALLDVDPRYLERTLSRQDDESLRKAWAGGADRWEISAGAFFADVFARARCVLPLGWRPPAHWRVTRCFDWGSARPYACYWLAESPGEEIPLPGGRRLALPRGSLVAYSELYGTTGKANEGTRQTSDEVARLILLRDRELGVRPAWGVADSAIFAEADGASVAAKMRAAGVIWHPCTKGPGSRVNGWGELRARFAACGTGEGRALYLTEDCRHALRTIPALQRDKRDPDDLDSEAEDHAADALRYRVTTTPQTAGVASLTGY